MILADNLSSALTVSSTAFWAGLLMMALIEAAIVRLVRRSIPNVSRDLLEGAYASGRISFKTYMSRKYKLQGYAVE